MSKRNDITCISCGAVYGREFTKCPYCGRDNYYAQEKAYMQGLSVIRQRMAELAQTDPKIVVKEAVKVLGLIMIAAAVIFAVAAGIKEYDQRTEINQFEQIRDEIINEIQ